MSGLAHLYVREGEEPSAAKWNELVREAIRRLPYVPQPPKALGTFVHPWKVSAARDTTPANVDGRLWRIRTELGCVNDVAAAFVYRAKDDPRGWKPPANVDPAKTPLADRTMLETDDPPYVALTAPTVGQTLPTDHFQPVPDSARPSFFRTAAMWEKRLYQADVVLTAEPSVAVSPDLPAVLLERLPTRYRVTAGRKPVTPVAQAGGLQEIARLYLLRNPAARDALSDTILVRQFLFWDVFEAYVQPANPLDGYGDAGALGAIVGGIVAGDLQDAATVQWWSS